MEVEARRPAEQQPAPFERAPPGVREERVEVDEAWVDEDGLAGRKRDLAEDLGVSNARLQEVSRS